MQLLCQSTHATAMPCAWGSCPTHARFVPDGGLGHLAEDRAFDLKRVLGYDLMAWGMHTGSWHPLCIPDELGTLYACIIILACALLAPGWHASCIQSPMAHLMHVKTWHAPCYVRARSIVNPLTPTLTKSLSGTKTLDCSLQYLGFAAVAGMTCKTPVRTALRMPFAGVLRHRH